MSKLIVAQHRAPPDPAVMTRRMRRTLEEITPDIAREGARHRIESRGSLILGTQKPDPEIVSAYECGFEAFEDARTKFDVRFYLVSILFIIFDLEVAFLFPWAASLGALGMFGFWSMVVFLGILTIGFVYEWKKGALEWE